MLGENEALSNIQRVSGVCSGIDQLKILVLLHGTHIIDPEWYSATGTTSLPFASTALVILKAAKIDTIAIHAESRARYLPGQMLKRLSVPEDI